MNGKMKCFKVICRDDDMHEYKIGVMTFDEFSAKHCAENSLFEGRHIKAKAYDVIEVDGI